MNHGCGRCLDQQTRNVILDLLQIAWKKSAIGQQSDYKLWRCHSD
jgi:hypothetical protein